MVNPEVIALIDETKDFIDRQVAEETNRKATDEDTKTISGAFVGLKINNKMKVFCVDVTEEEFVTAILQAMTSFTKRETIEKVLDTLIPTMASMAADIFNKLNQHLAGLGLPPVPIPKEEEPN